MDVTAVQILGATELDGQGLNGDVEVVDAESGERVRVSIGQRERDRYRKRCCGWRGRSRYSASATDCITRSTLPA